MTRGRTVRRRRERVSVNGPWLAIGLDFLRSRACASLSPHGTKMLIDFVSRLGPHASGNGDLSAAPEFLESRGWRSKATAQASIRELIDADLLLVTRQGGRNRCSLYAVTLWPINCDPSKLDTGPGSFTTTDWARTKGSEAPASKEAPAVWNQPRKRDSLTPAAGEAGSRLPPQGGKANDRTAITTPAAGEVMPKVASQLPPLRGSFLDKPSVPAAGTRMGLILARATPRSRSPAYIAARQAFGVDAVRCIAGQRIAAA